MRAVAALDAVAGTWAVGAGRREGWWGGGGGEDGGGGEGSGGLQGRCELKNAGHVCEGCKHGGGGEGSGGAGR